MSYTTKRVVIIPQNKIEDIYESYWYCWASEEIRKLGVPCELENMEDPFLAREVFWLPYLHDHIKCDENCILIGHGYGAAAALRYAEKYKVSGLVLISASCSFHGDIHKKITGYYDREWNWDKIRADTQWIVQFGSTDDSVPWDEQHKINESLKTELYKFTDRGNFSEEHFPELIDVIRRHLST